MNIQTGRTFLSSLIILTILTGCGVPKATIQLLDKNSQETIEFPTDYMTLLPTPTFELWDKDYNVFNRYLTQDIMRTQMGLSYDNKGVQTWWCYPSARTHAQLDTATFIRDKNKVTGDWRIINQRRITHIDSASYSDNKINRSSKLDEQMNDDVYLSMADGKFKLYAKTKGKTDFKRVGNKNYDIESNRYLMLYGIAKAGAAISQIGLDKNGYLIINTSYVTERKIKEKYITYQATVTQMIFKRIE